MRRSVSLAVVALLCVVLVVVSLTGASANNSGPRTNLVVAHRARIGVSGCMGRFGDEQSAHNSISGLGSKATSLCVAAANTSTDVVRATVYVIHIYIYIPIYIYICIHIIQKA